MLLLSSTSCAAFAPPSSTSVAFGLLPSRRSLLVTPIISNYYNDRSKNIAPSLLGDQHQLRGNSQLYHSLNTIEIDQTQNSSRFEDSLESAVTEIDEQTTTNTNNNNGGVAGFINNIEHHKEEHDTCIFTDDDDDDDTIEELFTSLLHKVGKYNADAVTLSYDTSTTNNNNNTNNNNTINTNNQTQPISMLRQAYNIARTAHQNQCRKSGEPYITHPLGVAHIIADDMGLFDLTSLLTAILHDTVEDTHVTLEDIERMFGKEIRQCVDGVTKIAKIAFTSYEEQQSENYRKLILAMSKDIVSLEFLTTVVLNLFAISVNLFRTSIISQSCTLISLLFYLSSCWCSE